MLNKLKLFTQIAVPIVFLFCSGCATIEGAGKDIENAGEAIQESAEK